MALSPVGQKLRDRDEQVVDTPLGSIDTSKLNLSQAPQSRLQEQPRFSPVGQKLHLSPIGQKLAEPEGYISNVLLPSAKGAIGDFFKSEEERRAEQTIGEEAVTDIKRTGQILKFAAVDFPRLIAGGLTEAGKTLQELALTYGRAAVTDDTVGEASLKAQEAVQGTEGERQIAEKLFGFVPESMGGMRDAIDDFLENQPEATEAEKQVLPLLLPILAFGAELTPFGGSGKGLTKAAIRRLINSVDETEIAKVLRDSGLPDEVADKAAPRLITQNTEEGVNRTLKEASQEVIDEFSAGRLADDAIQEGASTRVADDIPEELATEARKYDSAEEFVRAEQPKAPAFENVRNWITKNTPSKAGAKKAGVTDPLKLVAERIRKGDVPKDVFDDMMEILPNRTLDRETGEEFVKGVSDEYPRTGTLMDFLDSYDSYKQRESQLTDIFNRVKGGDDKFISDRVVQLARPNGETVMYRIPKDEFDEIENLIDTGRTADTPIAMNQKTKEGVFHVTAKTPEQMLSREGVVDGGTITARDMQRVSDKVIEGAPIAEQRQGTRVLTQEGKKFVESPKEKLDEAVQDQGFSSEREIEDLVRVPVKTSEDIPSLQDAARAEGFDTQPAFLGGLEVRDIAGQQKFDIETAKAVRKGDIDVPSYIAMRTMRDGSKRPAVRKSGVFAEKDWERHQFRDVKGLLGEQSFNLRDGLLSLDNITAREAGETGTWGPGAHLQYSVRQADGARATFGVYHGQRIRHALETRGLKPNTQTGKQLNLALWGVDKAKLGAGQIDEAVDEVIAKLDVTHKAAKKARPKLIKAAQNMGDEVFEAADEIRRILDELRDQANVVRKEMGKPTIGFIEDYGPLLQRQSFWQQMRQSKKTEITDNFDFILPNAKKNPHAIPRKGGMDSFETNALDTLERYIDNVSNDIFTAPQIEKLKAVREVLHGRGFDGISRLIDRVIREGLVGQPGPIDTMFGFRQGTKRSAAVSRVTQARSVYALAGNPVWTAFIQPASVAMMTIPRAGGVTHGMQNFLGGLFDFVSNKALRKKLGQRPTQVVKTRGASVGMTGAGDMDQLAGKIQKGKIDSFNSFVGKFSDANEYWLTSSSMAAGYRDGARLGLKGRDLDIYADWMGGATQSEYNRLARPLFLNNQLVRLGAPFQTFAFELYRYSKTLVGAPGGIPLEKSQRLNQVIMLMAGAYVYNQYTEATIGRTLTTPGSAIPIVGGWVDQKIDQVKAALGFKKQERFGHGRSPVAPAEDVNNLIDGVDSFVNDGNIQPLRKEIVNWGMGLSRLSGASAVNRFVDGMIANVTGMQTTRSGEFAFPVEGSDQFIAPILGPYSTQAGKKYLNEQKETERQEAEVRPIFNQVQELIEAGKDEEAQAIVDSLRGEEWETYKKIRAVERRKRTEELKVQMAPVYQEAKTLVENGKEEEAQQLVDGLSDEEWKAYELVKEQAKKFEAAKEGKEPIWGDGEVDNASNVIEVVRVYAEAVFNGDVESAFQALFTDEKIRKVEGDAVIFQRAPLRETQQERERQADEMDIDSLEEMRLDHTIPLQLGGDNSQSNLRLVPQGLWESYTDIENHLGNLLRDGEIKEKEAQRLIKDFKEGRISAGAILDL